jgi:UDP-N-acetyl-D-mannosaminuronic acid transferase (WecB/TagA/CpsF family)
MHGVELTGKVVVVPAELDELAMRMATKGATVVLVGPDPGALGQVAGRIEAAGPGRPAVFVSDGSEASLDALAAFLSELFRDP